MIIRNFLQKRQLPSTKRQMAKRKPVALSTSRGEREYCWVAAIFARSLIPSLPDPPFSLSLLFPRPSYDRPSKTIALHVFASSGRTLGDSERLDFLPRKCFFFFPPTKSIHAILLRTVRTSGSNRKSEKIGVGEKARNSVRVRRLQCERFFFESHLGLDKYVAEKLAVINSVANPGKRTGRPFQSRKI